MMTSRQCPSNLRFLCDGTFSYVTDRQFSGGQSASLTLRVLVIRQQRWSGGSGGCGAYIRISIFRYRTIRGHPVVACIWIMRNQGQKDAYIFCLIWMRLAEEILARTCTEHGSLGDLSEISPSPLAILEAVPFLFPFLFADLFEAVYRKKKKGRNPGRIICASSIICRRNVPWNVFQKYSEIRIWNAFQNVLIMFSWSNSLVIVNFVVCSPTARAYWYDPREMVYASGLMRYRDNKSALFFSSDIIMRNAYLTGKRQRVWLLMNRLNSNVITAIAFCTVLTPLRRDDVEHFHRDGFETSLLCRWLSFSAVVFVTTTRHGWRTLSKRQSIESTSIAFYSCIAQVNVFLLGWSIFRTWATFLNNLLRQSILFVCYLRGEKNSTAEESACIVQSVVSFVLK